MSRRLMAGAALAPALTAVAGVVAAAPAGADGPGDPLYGDVNGDGHVDRVVLAADPAKDRCGVVVQLSDGNQFLLPKTYYYPAPGTTDVRYCPDMGVIVDLGGDGVSELVLAWFNGGQAPPGVQDLLVLEDFTPAGGFDAINQPSFIGTQHFNTDGLLDIYEYTDQGQGIRTWLNTPSGQLVPGPIDFSHGGLGGYEFADFDENGASDVAFPFFERFIPGQPDEPFMGVAVILDDGTVTYLETADLNVGLWDSQVADANNDGHLDVRTFNGDTGATRLFLGQGDGTFRAPK